jgi:hypothetical protein
MTTLLQVRLFVMVAWHMGMTSLAAFETRRVIDGFHHIVSAPQRAPFPVIAAIMDM